MPIIFLIMITLISLVNQSLNAQTDNHLNGRWVRFAENVEEEYYFNNGNYEFSNDKVTMQKGLYEIEDRDIIFYVTYLYGGIFNEIMDRINDAWGNVLYEIFDDFKFELKMYSEDDLFHALKPFLQKLETSEEDIINFIDFIFWEHSSDSCFYIDNTLVITSVVDDEEVVMIFTKR